MPLNEQLADAPLFRNLTEAQIDKLLSLGERVNLNQGQVIVEEGEPNDALFLLLDGSLMISVGTGRLGNESAVRLSRPGDVIGEYSAIDRAPASARVSSVGMSEVFRLSLDSFQQALAEDALLASNIYRNMLVSLIERLRDKDAELYLFRAY